MVNQIHFHFKMMMNMKIQPIKKFNHDVETRKAFIMEAHMFKMGNLIDFIKKI